MSATSERQTQPLSPLVRPGIARVSVISGALPQGSDFVLPAGSMQIGGTSELSFGVDGSISPVEATLVNDNGTLVIQPGSAAPNVFIQRKQDTALRMGDHFMVGNERLRVVAVNDAAAHQAQDGTKLFTSPVREGGICVQQIVQGKRIGASANSKNGPVSIGVGTTGLILSHNSAISGVHAEILPTEDGAAILRDNGSVNGVYSQLKDEEVLGACTILWIRNVLVRIDIDR